MACLVSLLAGIAVGAAYALLGVKSPAPPVIALFGLLGIVIGEQGVPWIKERVANRAAIISSTIAAGRHGDQR